MANKILEATGGPGRSWAPMQTFINIIFRLLGRKAWKRRHCDSYGPKMPSRGAWKEKWGLGKAWKGLGRGLERDWKANGGAWKGSEGAWKEFGESNALAAELALGLDKVEVRAVNETTFEHVLRALNRRCTGDGESLRLHKAVQL